MSNNPKMITQEARCGVRLNYFFFPIEFRELRRALAKHGYELSSVGLLPAAPARIRYGGDVARKGETIVIAESDRGKIGVVGRSLQEVRDSFEELANVIDSELGISLHENLSHYWYSVHYRVKTQKAPRNEIVKTASDAYLKRFEEILGEDLGLFSVRLAPKGATANQEDWFDIAIEQDVLNENLYHVGVVFRNHDRSKTETFVKDLENNILKLIGAIEG